MPDTAISDARDVVQRGLGYRAAVVYPHQIGPLFHGTLHLALHGKPLTPPSWRGSCAPIGPAGTCRRRSCRCPGSRTPGCSPLHRSSVPRTSFFRQFPVRVRAADICGRRLAGVHVLLSQQLAHSEGIAPPRRRIRRAGSGWPSRRARTCHAPPRSSRSRSGRKAA